MRIVKAWAAGVTEFKKFLPRLLAIASELFHEVMGFVFFALALWLAFAPHGLKQSYLELGENPEGLPAFLGSLLFVLLFGAFGVSSFRRARRVAKRH